MKKYVLSFVLFAAAVFCVSQTYGQKGEPSLHQEIYVTFTNSTNTEAHLSIKEEKTKHPYTYLPIKEITLASGETESTPLFISLNNDNKATLSIFTSGGEGYGQTGSNIEIDTEKSDVYNVKLTESWVYPGDGFWYVDPFRIIKARVQK